MNRSYDSPLPFTDISERYDELMDAPVRTKDGTYISSMSLADRAYQHAWFGRQISKQPPRFGFHFDDDAPVIEYLGTDADTNGHMYEAALHAAQLLRHHPEINLSDEDRGILMFALLGHDMDETTHDQIRHTCGGVTGDIACGKKTDADRALQVKIRRTRDLHLYQDIPQATLERVEAIIAHKDASILGMLYEAAHELQSYETTLVAEETLINGAYASEDKAGIEHVAFTVRQEVLERLAPHTGRFAYIGSRIHETSQAA